MAHSQQWEGCGPQPAVGGQGKARAPDSGVRAKTLVSENGGEGGIDAISTLEEAT